MTTSETTNGSKKSPADSLRLAEVSAEEYRHLFSTPTTFFHSEPFNSLNASKCEELIFLVLLESERPKIGLSGGVTQGVFKSPFSAPYGGPQPISDRVTQRHCWSLATLLSQYLEQKSIRSMKMVLPPIFYAEDFYTGLFNSLFNSGYVLETVDLNYHLPLDGWDQDRGALGVMNQSARRNLRKSQKSNLSFRRCTDSESRRACYELIQQNHGEKGYPLHMTYDQVRETTSLIDHDFFLVTHEPTGDAVAAAIEYRVRPDVAQLIYWGSPARFSKLKAMNFLSYNMSCFFQEHGVRIFDAGPATEDGEPNYGLVQFKKSIGCRTTSKLSWSKRFS